MSTAVIDVTDDTFEKEAVLAGKKVLIDFWADWCGPCKALVPLLDEVAEKYSANLKVIKVNVEITPEISKRFGVRGLPTLVLLDGSEEIGRVAGCTNSSLFTFLNKHLSVELAPDQPDAPVVKKPAHKGPFSAFHHDLQLKETMLQRAALGAQQARITGLINYYLPDQDRGSPIAWLLQTPEIDQIEERLGIPESVAALYEYLFYSLLKRDIVDEQLSDVVVPQALPLLHEWLSAIEPGKDLTPLPSLFAVYLINEILRGAFAPFTQLAEDQIVTLRRLADHHEKTVAGHPHSDADAKLITHAIEQLRKKYTDSWSQTIVGFAEQLVRPTEESRRAVAGGIIQLVIGYHSNLTENAYSKDELELRQKSITAAAVARQQNPAADRATFEALPEYLAWIDVAPLERQWAIDKEAGQVISRLSLELHRGLVSLT